MADRPEPRQWWIEATEASVPLIRRQIIETVGEWRICDDEDSLFGVGVCASELLTNGVDHAWTNMLGITLAWTGTAIRIEVIDDDPLFPTRCDGEVGDVDGRGLALLEALGRWGAERKPYGKVVWAEIPIPLDTRWTDA